MTEYKMCVKNFVGNMTGNKMNVDKLTFGK